VRFGKFKICDVSLLFCLVAILDQGKTVNYKLKVQRSYFVIATVRIVSYRSRYTVIRCLFVIYLVQSTIVHLQ
jgi:hypothetical protein